MVPNRYNIRVYGLLLNDQGQILVTDENRMGKLMTKFPGGGHELGESLAECLQREFEEELNLQVRVGDLFYINEFLQISAFNPLDQILSVYYWVESDEWHLIETADEPFDFSQSKDPSQIFRWMHIDAIQETDLTFPIDKVVLKKLQQRI